MIPCLLITHNRLAFTKRALQSIIESDCGGIYIFENGSTDGTAEFVRDCQEQDYFVRRRLKMSSINLGIAAAMNWFLDETKDFEYCIKVDSDTLIPHDFCARMLPHMAHADIVQAKHEIIKATHPDGWGGFTKGMRRKGNLLFNSFVGGSGTMFKRSRVNYIPETEWKLGGFRQFQRENPSLIKAFADDVEIELLDGEKNGGYPEEYKTYYQSTGRLC